MAYKISSNKVSLLFVKWRQFLHFTILWRKPEKHFRHQINKQKQVLGCVFATITMFGIWRSVALFCVLHWHSMCSELPTHNANKYCTHVRFNELLNEIHLGNLSYKSKFLQYFVISYPVEVCVWVLWHVIVEDNIHSLNVHTSTKQVCRYQYTLLKVLKQLIVQQSTGARQ